MTKAGFSFRYPIALYPTTSSLQTMKSSVFYRSFRKNYPLVERAEGIYIYADGKRYIDGSSGAVAVNIGHGVKEVIDAMNAQMQNVSFAHTERFTNEWQEKLADLLQTITPNKGLSYFVSSGSEANETAFKLARQYHVERGNNAKWKIISRSISYHGNTMAALSASGDAAKRKNYDPLFLQFPQVDPCYCYRCDKGNNCNLECANALEDEILKQGPETVSAFIAEPIVGAAGAALVPHKDYFKTIEEICDLYDILLIADEIMTGFGRTGKMFGMEHFNVNPDIMTVGKGLTSGYAPLSACIASQEIAGTIANGSGSFIHGTTYTGNPVSCAAGFAAVSYLIQNKLHENAEKVGAYIMQQLNSLNHHLIGDIRGKGLLLGVEFVKDKTTKEKGAIAKKVLEKCADNGLLLYEAGRAAGYDCLLIAPPLITTMQQADDILNIFTDVVSKQI